MSSSSREGSPDWLRSFQAPTTTSLLSLSSSSESAPDDSPYRESETISSSLPLPDDTEAPTLLDSKTKLVTKQVSIQQVFSRKKKSDAALNLGGEQFAEKQKGNKVDGEENSTKLKNDQGGDDSVWLLSSDSEPPSSDPIREQLIISTEEDEDLVILDKEGEPAVKKKPPKKKPNSGRQIPKEDNSAQEIISEDKDTDSIVAEEATTDKNTKPSSSGSSSRLPLVLSEKVNRTKVLVECEGDSIDLSGDMGAVGRVVVSDTTEDVLLDLKGIALVLDDYSHQRMHFQVNVGQSEAKIEAIMNDFIQLTPVSNVYEAETMVEGTLEGFLFDSDEEGNKNAKTASKPPDDQNGDTAEITKGSGKAKAKAKGENVVVGKKRGRPAKEKQQQQQPAKKARSCAPKKTKPKK
ncbi:hypothetical protein Bca4012_067533 [Brassica carinata]